ncbi:MAG: hypothetical protein JWQ96_1254 [Segetibacter sp.]|nr:hypothetical protein [Segetibacter sp.]
MIKKLLFAVLFFAIAKTSLSQSNEGHGLLVRFNFLGLIDFLDNNLTTGFEYKLNNHWSTGTDVGYVFASNYFMEAKKVNGILVRPFLRLYPKGKPDFFIETELHYKQVTYEIEDWIGKLPDNGVSAYQEFTTFNYKKRAVGGHVRFGEQMNLSMNKLLKMEVTAGIGYRNKKEYTDEGLYQPSRSLLAAQSDTQETARRESLFVVPINFRLCYAIK